ncbi:hypothetical protein FC64_GL000096 [Ligilactobacillus araffinosus DSM 20653]|uniref:Uncharacterized protein n=2 Tax=Ligilactobacillus araffinosus TaxID=147809 RepID=A0A0R1ZJM6_9LACO|nr:hypothetical protein FC64_GL000096 [Ligilactobacillus araffinosus DSM 20653]
MDAENNQIDMNNVVIYEGKDIKAWAKKRKIAYPDALNRFRSVLFGDNGKEYFIKK